MATSPSQSPSGTDLNVAQMLTQNRVQDVLPRLPGGRRRNAAFTGRGGAVRDAGRNVLRPSVHADLLRPGARALRQCVFAEREDRCPDLSTARQQSDAVSRNLQPEKAAELLLRFARKCPME
jgi:hypothetical protein